MHACVRACSVFMYACAGVCTCETSGAHVMLSILGPRGSRRWRHSDLRYRPVELVDQVLEKCDKSFTFYDQYLYVFM